MKALEEYRKQLVERMGEIQNLSEQLDFNDLIHYFRDKSSPKI